MSRAARAALSQCRRKYLDDPKPKSDFGYFAQRASRQLRHVGILIVAGVEVGPIRGTEPIPLFVQSIDSLIGILTILGVLQYASRSSVNANLLRGASAFDVE